MRYRLKEYDAEAVAFDTASGDTHYLAPLALTLYRLYRDRPGLSRDEARTLAARYHDVEWDPSLDAQVDETLEGLCRIGLLQPE
ncbi:MAG TPA: HPr-rel-A system PqqD family peptide chaperone [Thiobacillaceae bacterium]|nr:HPr-rel-A system PqqD family peptide chaperone [Thiobacillaceae bacterium]